ncbi:MAG: D-alanyl-D-alanine carboxypeptidase [Alphaproteobacteria bacterium]|nr:D-alanyl-D-alanine carboxypeptidase [Alphaproteobacteria bacterium]
MRVLLVVLLLAGVILSAGTADARKRHKKRHIAPPEPYVERFAAIVIEADTGRQLYERMSHEQRYPASLTKMMTLYLLFEALQQGKVSLSTLMTASPYACSQDPTKLGLTPGDQIAVEDAIKALIVRSANDVAVVVAEHLGGNEYQFAARMTERARQMGMNQTSFVNASGLPDENQRSTATDLVVLSRNLIANFPQFYPYFHTQSFVWNGRSFEGHNNLMKFFDGADGLKTGYTRMSGFNLASSATRQGKRLIAVVMGGRSARDRDIQTAELLESEFTKMGLGRQAPVIMAMSPLVLDEEETAAADAADRASDFRPEPIVPASVPTQNAPPADTGAALKSPASQPVLATLQPSARDDGQGDTSADQQTRRDLTPPHGQWGIQVGAHLSRARAEAQLQQVRQQARDLVGKAKFAIVELDVRGEVFYRVRFGAFTPAKAESLCGQLQKRGTSCLVVTDGAWDASNARATLPIAVR